MASGLTLIRREDLDIDWWNERVTASKVRNPMIYGYVLDVLANNWCVISDGETLLPISFDTKYGFDRVRQFPFSRQIDVINGELNEALLSFLKDRFRVIDIGIGSNGLLPNDQCFQYLDLSHEAAYSNNAKRLIKRSEKYTYQLSDRIDVLSELYDKNTRQKMKLPVAYTEKLRELMRLFVDKEKGFLIQATFENEVRAAIFVILDKNVAYYLMADADPEEKKEGVIFGLMDRAIAHSRALGCELFDFGGSNDAKVAAFYKKFGAQDRQYARIRFDTSPLWYRLLKKFRK